MDKLERYLLISLAAIFVLVFLRWLKRFLRRNEIQERFPYVYPFEGSVLGAFSELLVELPYSDRVKVELFSPEGKLVKTLEESLLPAGTHRIAIQLDDVDAGDYELKLSFSNQITRRNIRRGE